jgi:hypothetical protein
VTAVLKLPDHLEILWIVALGKPVETVVLEELEGEDIRYWRDETAGSPCAKTEAGGYHIR